MVWLIVLNVVWIGILFIDSKIVDNLFAFNNKLFSDDIFEFIECEFFIFFIRKNEGIEIARASSQLS